jgi:hypothetical protein
MDEVVEGAQGLVDGNLAGRSVNVVDVQVVGLQAP